MHGVEKMGEEEDNLREDIEADGDDDSVLLVHMEDDKPL